MTGPGRWKESRPMGFDGSQWQAKYFGYIKFSRNSKNSGQNSEIKEKK